MGRQRLSCAFSLLIKRVISAIRLLSVHDSRRRIKAKLSQGCHVEQNSTATSLRATQAYRSSMGRRAGCIPCFLVGQDAAVRKPKPTLCSPRMLPGRQAQARNHRLERLPRRNRLASKIGSTEQDMKTADLIQERLAAAFEPSSLSVKDQSDAHKGHSGWREGGETHFHVEIRSRSFAGMTRLEMHRAVHDALSPDPLEKIHALSLKVSAE